jgi:hypothetical protein
LNTKFLAVERYHHNVTIEDMTETARTALEALFSIDQITDPDRRQSMQDVIDGIVA